MKRKWIEQSEARATTVKGGERNSTLQVVGLEMEVHFREISSARKNNTTQRDDYCSEIDKMKRSVTKMQ